MALIKCPECGKDISNKAIVCPNCGNPISGEAISSENIRNSVTKRKPLYWVILAILLLIIAFILINSIDGNELTKEEAEKAVKESMEKYQNHLDKQQEKDMKKLDAIRGYK